MKCPTCRQGGVEAGALCSGCGVMVPAGEAKNEAKPPVRKGKK